MSDEDRSDLHIAVVGMAARFAGATTPGEFWRNIRDGVESITDFTDEELRERGVPDSLLRDPNYVKRAPVLEKMESFDAAFFGFNPKEGAIMDPQHRHFLECAWEALEDAGQPPDRFEGPVGVFAGNGMHAYMMYNLISNPGLMESEGLFLVRHTGNDKDFLSTRVSYALDLRGPSITVQTACSTSLVAIHMACQSLLNGEVDMALAGGVTIELPHAVGYLYKEGEILSPDGHCRSFDADSQGTLFGSGCGVVALRRLHDALDDGDPIHAVIVGSAINNDGASKVGYLAPSVDGQARCVTEALEIAEIDADSVQYIETHGTGTPVGDPIEVTALQQAFSAHTDEKAFCGIGSVKTNIGHTDTAAGVAGIIKVAQALKHKQLPPSLNFTAPNPRIDWDSSAFYVNDALKDWPEGDTPRRAGVNSLGVGGTNAHIFLEEASEQPPTAKACRDHHLFLFSAKSAASLDGAPPRLAAHLEEHTDLSTADAEWTLQVGRARLPERRAVVATSADPAVALGAFEDGPRATAPNSEQSVAFMFAGGGAQYPDMGRGLYESEPAYRAAFDECVRLSKSDLDFDLAALVFPEAAAAAAASLELQKPSRTLPALFATQYAQAMLWRSWGIEPAAMIGHSMGEYTAATIAGVFSLRDALAIVALRGRLFEKVAAGGMLSVQLDAEDLTPRLGDLSLAAVNAPGLSLASGPIAEIERLQRELEVEDIKATRIHIDVAAHSSMLDPILDEFRAYLDGVRFGNIELPFVSNLTGTWAEETDVRSAGYWVRHLRETVRFSDGVSTLMRASDQVLLEVGPGRTLATLARITSGSLEAPPTAITNSLPHPDLASESLPFMLERLGELWVHGVEPDWEAFHGDDPRRKVSLPGYVWNHRKLWIEPGEHAYRGEQGASEPLARVDDPQEWLFRPVFTPAELVDEPIPDGPIAIFSDQSGLASAVVERARATGRRVFVILPGTRFARLSGGIYRVRPGSAEDHKELLRDLSRSGDSPSAFLDLRPCKASGGGYEHGRRFAFDGPFHLVQSLSDFESARVVFALDGGFELAGEGGREPLQSLALGPATVIGSEHPGITASAVDVRWSEANERQTRRAADALVGESLVRVSERIVAYRDGVRLRHSYVPAKVEYDKTQDSHGCVLITGGFGGLGLAAARGLARPGARLALLGRSALPPRDQWDDYCAAHDARDRTRQRIEAVGALEKTGARVLTLAADVADTKQLSEALRKTRAELGEVRGVIHTAGVLDDDLIVFKDLQRADRVLRPKVAGAIALREALGDVHLDYFILYSSVSATLGMAGQCDYAAANSYLNAFAAQRASQGGERCVALGWPAWQDVGMAAELAAETFRRDGGREVAHPFLDRCVRQSPGVGSYVTEFSAEQHWLLDEHRLQSGGALIPGTGFLELARAALVDGSSPSSAIELRDVVFMSAFFVPEQGTRGLRLDLRSSRDGWSDLAISSGGPELDREQHVAGQARILAEFAEATARYGAIRKRCKRRIDLPEGPKADPHLAFGKRWGNLRRIDVGVAEALLELELDVEFESDLESVRMHPAILDFATAGAQMLVSGNADCEAFYVPVGYLRLTFSGSMSPRLFSHVRLVSTPGDGELAVYEATVFEPSGRVVLRAEEFTMRRIDDLASFEAPSPSEAGASSTRASALDEALARGLSSTEGVSILTNLLRSDGPAELLVSPVDYNELVAESSAESAPTVALTVGAAADDSDAELELPRTEVERAIAAIWTEALGVPTIGIDADFFGLGGHSLVAIRITSRLNQTFGVDLPLRALFEGPTVRKLAELVEDLAGVVVPDGEEPDPRELARRTGDHPLVAVGSEIPLLDRTGPLRPSFAQEGLWFLDQLQPGNVAYNIPMALRLRGNLNRAALDRAVSEIVRRHESTRIRFVEIAGSPHLAVAEPAEQRLGVVDIEDATAFACASAARPFDLATGPLFRAELGRLAADDHVLVVTMHHIVSDEWSLELLYQELGPLYETWSNDPDAASPLEELPIQYADFAAWRRERMTEELFSEELEYWASALEGAQTVLELPADRPRPAVQTFSGARAIHEFGSRTHRLLHDVAKAYGVTPFVAMLGAFHAFLYRITGQDDVILGSPSSTRTRVEAENLVGFFVNTLVLRGNLAGAPTYADVIARTRACAMDAFANSDLPFDRLVRELEVSRDASRNPLFQVMFALFPSVREIDMAGLSVESLEVDTGGAQIDLTLYASDGEESLRGIFEYNTDLFDKETVLGFGRSFEALLLAMLEDPDAGVDEHEIVIGDARVALLDSLNPPLADAVSDRSVHHLFEARRKETPDALAIEAGDATWTYRELDQRANQIARHLRALGVGAGDYVGVCSTRGAHLVAALLGVMKAGGAYLPLDPAFPRERLAFMLAETAAPVVLTESALREFLPPSGATTVELDTDWPEIASRSSNKLPASVVVGPLAYVIFTSGSTGTPKGVQVPHAAVVNFLETMAQTPGLERSDVLLAVTTISFDISVLELFLPLSVGAKLVLVDKDVSSDGRRLAARIAETRTTVVQATPATWRLLFDSGWRGDPSLRVLCGGEALPKDLAAQLLGTVGQLWNMYGPTETTIWSTIARIENAEDIHIGTPVANTRCYVLDDRRRPVPLGTPGVLWIGGHGVTSGYVNRPDLTAERFVADPFVDGEGRMYNTGDVVRWRRDGALQYLSRVDTQVKVRGFRIELGEIEALLARVPGVRAAVVAAHDFGSGDVRLVGYVVPAAGPLEAAALRAALRTDLPDYMVPSMWETIAELPLTANAKVDRKALPVPGGSAVEPALGVAPPATENERFLVGLWSELLRVDSVGIHDNFFDLGGHSLLAMQMIARVADSQGHRFNPLEVSLQTLGQLAAVLPSAEQPPIAPPLVEEPTSPSATPAARVQSDGSPAPGEHRRLLKKAVRRLASRFGR